ncbi:hypothetical protein QN277_015758 [Acacia crassicarpa]|uniref:Uncharacterized protein n=1 Tax=Acacia crassicarpa TaxID=499986 RepID=A0AAE1MVK3_9FABA|nr:hypothetical protein QN277_015758 [Acacia crassicarpa]
MKATKLYEQRTITSKLVRNLCFSGVTPRVVRISVSDNYATDSSSDKEDERGARFSRLVKKFIHEIRIEDLSSFRATSREVNGNCRTVLRKKRERPPARMARRKQSLHDGIEVKEKDDRAKSSGGSSALRSKLLLGAF